MSVEANIYDRVEQGGSVYDDSEVWNTGNLDDFEDYFGDTDPFEFL